MMEQKQEKFNAICDYFNAYNVMTIDDFNSICDDIDGEVFCSCGKELRTEEEKRDKICGECK